MSIVPECSSAHNEDRCGRKLSDIENGPVTPAEGGASCLGEVTEGGKESEGKYVRM